MKRLLLACGGTGGHFYPGYALARALRARGWETLFLLRTQDPAAAVLSRDDIPFVEIDLRGLPRGFSMESVAFPWRLLRSLRLTRNILRSYHPRCVVGMGGYLTFPAVLTARWTRVPSLIHESNAVLGLANRACLPFVSEVAMGLPIAEAPCPGKFRYELTGTPVRSELTRLPEPGPARIGFGLEPDRLTVLVFGGSQGARAINGLIPAALRRSAASCPKLQCLHLSGPKEESAVRSAYVDAPFPVRVLGFLQEMERAYAAADLVVCRAGASTLAELAAVRRPALLIPFPFAAAGHQETNARVLERAGAARCLIEKGLDSEALAAAISDLISSDSGDRFKTMARAYDALGLPSPNETVNRLVSAVERIAGIPDRSK